MKAGKEGVAGAIAAMEQWRDTDHQAVARAEAARLDRAEQMLQNIRGLKLEREPDPPGNPFERLMLHVDPRVGRISAFQLGQALAAGKPKIVLRTLHVDRGYLLLDVRRIDDAELDLVIGRIREVLAQVPVDAKPQIAPPSGDLTNRGLAKWLN